jgi:hypothetical protein
MKSSLVEILMMMCVLVATLGLILIAALALITRPPKECHHATTTQTSAPATPALQATPSQLAPPPPDLRELDDLTDWLERRATSY